MHTENERLAFAHVKLPLSGSKDAKKPSNKRSTSRSPSRGCAQAENSRFIVGNPSGTSPAARIAVPPAHPQPTPPRLEERAAYLERRAASPRRHPLPLPPATDLERGGEPP